MTPHIATGVNSRGALRAQESIPARVVVHVVDIDDGVLLALCRSLACSGMELRFHSHLADFLTAHRATRPSCLVIDAQLLFMTPLPCDIHCPIVVTTSHPEIALVVRAMKSGAIDVMEKPPCEERLTAAVVEAIEKDRQRCAVESCHAALRARFETLTPREREVMALVTAGLLNKLVAADLGLSEITVKAHRGSVMRKMGARSIADLVRMADIIGDALTLSVRNRGSGHARMGPDLNRQIGHFLAPYRHSTGRERRSRA